MPEHWTAQCLYKPAGAVRYRARAAWRLIYRSQCLALAWRLQERSFKFRDRVLAAGSPEWRAEYGDWEFPPKPPRMRWSTYERLYEAFDHYSGWGEPLVMERLLRFRPSGEGFGSW